METTLWANPAFPCDHIEGIHARVERPSRTLLQLHYAVVGNISQICVPPPAPPRRTSGLWETTCFEAFLRAEGENAYVELNFSPSGQWAAYAFSHYRQGMANAPLPAAPEISVSRGADWLKVQVAVSPILEAGPYELNVAAILETAGGGRSFWAARHPCGEPDFHHPSCFIHQLPPAPRS